MYRIREIARQCKLAERIRNWENLDLTELVCLDETVLKGYHRKGKPGRRVAVSKVIGLVGCCKRKEHQSVRIVLTECVGWNIMVPFCCLCVPPDGVTRTSML